MILRQTASVTNTAIIRVKLHRTPSILFPLSFLLEATTNPSGYLDAFNSYVPSAETTFFVGVHTEAVARSGREKLGRYFLSLTYISVVPHW
jgi:hypothetical protein